MRKRAGVLVCSAAILGVVAPSVADAPGIWRAHGTGANEVPARETRAQAQALCRLSADGTSLEYRLNVANIDNVVQAHIHLGRDGANGPPVAFLYGPVAGNGGPSDGRLAEGTITAAGLRGPLAGQTIADLVEQIEAGNAYVNVHTDDGVAPAHTGPGDFPGGEVRGPLR